MFSSMHSCLELSVIDREGTAALTRLERRNLGRFDTPRPIAQAIADWAIRGKNDTILEPSCGGGVIVKSILARLRELGSRIETFSPNVFACDIDKRALEETKKCCKPLSLNLIHGNFIELGVNSFGAAKFDAVVGNPPYVRLHAMDKRQREECRNSLPDGITLGAKAGLWAYFPIHAYKLLKKGGRMAWILPESLLHSTYGKQVLDWASKNFSGCLAVSLRERCFIQDGAKERIVILLLDGAYEEASRQIQVVEYNTANDCINALKKYTVKISSGLPKLNGHTVPHLVSREASEASNVFDCCPSFVPFSHFAEIKIGIVTGNNKFFVVSDLQRQQLKIHPRHFKRIISKFSQLGSAISFTGEGSSSLSDKWLLYPLANNKDKKLDAYLSTYPEKERLTNRTMAKRPLWQNPILGTKPDAFLQSMGAAGPRLVLNCSAHFCTNTIHAIYFKDSAKDLAVRRAICLSMYSTYTQLSAEFEGRQYGSGVLKIEPSEGKRIKIAYGHELFAELAANWRQLSSKARSKGWWSIAVDVDAIISKHLPEINKQLAPSAALELLSKVRLRRVGKSISLGVK